MLLMVDGWLRSTVSFDIIGFNAGLQSVDSTGGSSSLILLGLICAPTTSARVRTPLVSRMFIDPLEFTDCELPELS